MHILEHNQHFLCVQQQQVTPLLNHYRTHQDADRHRNMDKQNLSKLVDMPPLQVSHQSHSNGNTLKAKAWLMLLRSMSAVRMDLLRCETLVT